MWELIDKRKIAKNHKEKQKKKEKTECNKEYQDG